MCGISVILDKSKTLSSQAIVAMNKAMHHRGPDASNWIQQDYPFGTLFIGHTRLKIVDLEDNANQPMRKNGWVLSFNGEIYNYHELPIDPLKLTTKSDTEALLDHIILQKNNAYNTLQGMYASIVVDPNGDITLARDEYGNKPLYYYESDELFIASSSINAILSTQLIGPTEISSNSISSFLQQRYTSIGKTFYTTIHSIKPGRMYTIHQGNKLSEFGIINRKTLPTPDVDSIENTLLESIKKHSQADVEVGVLLSGGIDSSLILAGLHKLGHKKTPCFTAIDPRIPSSDAINAEKAANLFGAEWIPISIDAQSLELLDEYSKYIDQPVADAAGFLTYLICTKAREKGVISLLSGAGADEYFTGYRRHQAFHWYLKHPTLSTIVSQFAPIIGALSPSLRHFSNSITSDPSETYLRMCSLDGSFKNRAVDFSIDTLDAALSYDQSNYLIGDILSITDQGSMATGVEVRTPFLFQPLTDLANSLPAEYRMQHGLKWILKSILTSWGGNALIHQKKHGFGLDYSSWLEQKIGKHFLDRMTQTDRRIHQYIDKKSIKTEVSRFEKDKSNTQLLMALLLLDSWMMHR